MCMLVFFFFAVGCDVPDDVRKTKEGIDDVKDSLSDITSELNVARKRAEEAERLAKETAKQANKWKEEAEKANNKLKDEQKALESIFD